MAVPKIFQSFNSLLGSIVRKKNATVVGPSKQLVGEFPPVTFERLYEYYHGWDMIKRSMDTLHQKFMGSGIEINSNNEYFNVFIKKWWKTVNAKQKFSDFFLSVLITGNAIMELQYTSDGRLGNVEHIPMQTIWRIFRDQFANELKLVQVVDGVFKELDPEFFIHWMINNPDRQAFGKSEFHSAAAPRPVTSKVDPITGEPINPERTLRPLLDSQAILQNAEIEIKEKMGKPRLLVSAPGMPKDQMNEVQQEMADPNSDQYIWIFDKPIESAELQIQAQTKFDDYGNNVDAHIDIATGFASNVIKNPGGFSYSGGQTTMDVLDQRVANLQDDASEMIKDSLLKPLAESWGFKDFDEMEVEVSFTPTVRKPTLEDIRLLDPEAISPKERRKMYEVLNIPLDEQDYEEFQNEMTQDKQDQKDIQMTGAMMGGDPEEGDKFGGGDDGGKPPKPPGGDDSSSAPKSQKSGKSGQIPTPKAPKADQAKTQQPTPFKSEQPRPPRTDQRPENPNKKRRGESIMPENISEEAYIKEVAKKIAEEAVKMAMERIPLPPKAGQNDNSSLDLYVSKGLDTPGTPELTDPKVRDIYDENDEEQLNELPPNAPQKRADVKTKPDIQPEGTQYSPSGAKIDYEQKKDKKLTPEQYYEELERRSDKQKGGDTNDYIDEQSDGTYKDPYDLNDQMPPREETGQQTQTTNISPEERPSPDEQLYIDSGGSKPFPEGQQQVLGSPEEDEQPQVPAEGDPKDDLDEEEVQKSIDLQQQKKTKRNVEEAAVLPDAPEKRHRDAVPPEESDPELPLNDPEGREDIERKPQAQLDDTPLDRYSPESPEQETTNEEEPANLENSVNPGDADDVEPAIGDKDPIGDSSQQRLREEEEDGKNRDLILPNNSNFKMDNTGRNMKPDEQPVFEQGTSKVLSEDEYISNLPTEENPLETQGEQQEDGMLMKPQDIQQDSRLDTGDISLQSGQPDEIDPQSELDDNIKQGVDPEDVDPNVLHYDPETGRNYTDLTDEQGNEVPDLRFDQTEDSSEEQPEVELENPIITKEEYEQAKDDKSPIDGMQPMDGMQEITSEPPFMTEEEFNAELDKKSTNPSEPNPFDLDNKTEEPKEEPKPEKAKIKENKGRKKAKESTKKRTTKKRGVKKGAKKK